MHSMDSIEKVSEILTRDKLETGKLSEGVHIDGIKVYRILGLRLKMILCRDEDRISFSFHFISFHFILLRRG